MSLWTWVWHYQRANVDQIQQAIEQFSWGKSFRSLNINEMVFNNKTIKNIFSNFIPHETVTCDYRDPSWINSNIKQLIQEKSNTYRSYILNDKKPQIFHKVKHLQKQLKKLIEQSQEKYCINISKKVMDPMTRIKTYLSLLKTLSNNKKLLVFLLYFKTKNM